MDEYNELIKIEGRFCYQIFHIKWLYVINIFLVRALQEDNQVGGHITQHREVGGFIHREEAKSRHAFCLLHLQGI